MGKINMLRPGNMEKGVQRGGGGGCQRAIRRKKAVAKHKRTRRNATAWTKRAGGGKNKAPSIRNPPPNHKARPGGTANITERTEETKPKSVASQKKNGGGNTRGTVVFRGWESGPQGRPTPVSSLGVQGTKS